MTVISLITPVSSSFIKDWPAQNAVNLDTLDAFAGPCLIGQNLQTYTPRLEGVSGDPVLGTGGYIVGYYYRIWDQIYTWGEFRFGTAGINAGNGIWTVTMPVPAFDGPIGFTNSPGRGMIVGNALAWDNSTDSGKRPLVGQLATATTVEFFNPTGNASELVTNSGPVAWDFQDGISWFATYKRA